MITSLLKFLFFMDDFSSFHGEMNIPNYLPIRPKYLRVNGKTNWEYTKLPLPSRPTGDNTYVFNLRTENYDRMFRGIIIPGMDYTTLMKNREEETGKFKALLAITLAYAPIPTPKFIWEGYVTSPNFLPCRPGFTRTFKNSGWFYEPVPVPQLTDDTATLLFDELTESYFVGHNGRFHLFEDNTLKQREKYLEISKKTAMFRFIKCVLPLLPLGKKSKKREKLYVNITSKKRK